MEKRNKLAWLNFLFLEQIEFIHGFDWTVVFCSYIISTWYSSLIIIIWLCFCCCLLLLHINSRLTLATTSDNKGRSWCIHEGCSTCLTFNSNGFKNTDWHVDINQAKKSCHTFKQVTVGGCILDTLRVVFIWPDIVVSLAEECSTHALVKFCTNFL